MDNLQPHILSFDVEADSLRKLDGGFKSGGGPIFAIGATVINVESGEEITYFAERYAIEPVDDSSDSRILSEDTNFVRHRVLPQLSSIPINCADVHDLLTKFGAFWQKHIFSSIPVVWCGAGLGGLERRLLNEIHTGNHVNYTPLKNSQQILTACPKIVDQLLDPHGIRIRGGSEALDIYCDQFGVPKNPKPHNPLEDARQIGRIVQNIWVTGKQGGSISNANYYRDHILPHIRSRELV